MRQPWPGDIGVNFYIVMVLLWSDSLVRVVFLLWLTVNIYFAQFFFNFFFFISFTFLLFYFLFFSGGDCCRVSNLIIERDGSFTHSLTGSRPLVAHLPGRSKRFDDFVKSLTK
jgi:hypothetical protein